MQILIFILSSFQQNPCQHPIIILRDVAFVDMSALLSFVYQGEVYVSQDRLTTFLRTAEMLHIKGLTEQNQQQSHLAAHQLQRDQVGSDFVWHCHCFLCILYNIQELKLLLMRYLHLIQFVYCLMANFLLTGRVSKQGGEQPRFYSSSRSVLTTLEIYTFANQSCITATVPYLTTT